MTSLLRFTRAFHWRIRSRMSRLIEQRWLNIGLQAKMGTIVSAGLIGLMGIFAFLSISTAAQSAQQVLNERMVFARTSALALDSKLTYIESMLSLLAGSPGVPAQTGDPTAQNLKLMHDPRFGQGVYLLDTTGRLNSPTVEVEVALNLEDVKAIVEQASGEDGHISVIFEGHPWVLISIPVLDEGGARAGAVAVLIDLKESNIFPFVGPYDLEKSGVVEVIDNTGLILFSTAPQQAFNRTDPEGLISKLFVEGKYGIESCMGCSESLITEQVDEIIAFAPLSKAPWGVVVRQRSDDVFAFVRRLTLETLVVAFLALIGAMVLVWVTTRSVVNPVQSLKIAAERISSGDLSTPIAAGGTWMRSDEIGVLAKSFDSMRIGLKQSIEEIQSWNQELDARVRDRTQAALAAQMEAQAARDDLRAVIDSLSDSLVVIGTQDKRIQLVNQAAAAQYQHAGDIIGKPCDEVLHSDLRCQPPDCMCPLTQAVTTGLSEKVTHVHSDNGHMKYVDIVASPMRNSAGEITRIIELARDVTEEKLLKESLVRRNQQLSIINSIISTVNQTLNLEEILEYALDEILRLTDIDIGAVFLREEAKDSLKLMAYRGLSEEAANLAARMGMLDSSCGGVIETGEIIIVPDISRLSGRRARSLQREQVENLMHIPLIAKGNRLGSMCVGFCKQLDFNQEDKELLTAIGNHIAVTIENARLYADIQHKEHMSRELFKKSITAQEEERKRIARELHDDTSQTLTALLFAAEEGLEVNDVDQVKKKLQDIKQIAQSSIQGIHKLIFDLRPSLLDHLGLVPALRWFAGSRLESRGIRVNLEEFSEPRRLPPEIETVLFRVIQEAITNIAKHAAARNVGIIIHYQDQITTVTIEDDGIGFNVNDLAISPDNPRGLGLLGMQERLELMGGEMEINAIPGQGTQLYIRLPTERGV